MSQSKPQLLPRKKPLQNRSVVTVEAIYDATIQVLLDAGMDRLTTTRVAERAGVSVGTLYQYFPNKSALLAGALYRHLSTVVEAVERACSDASGSAIETMAEAVVTAFADAKLRDAPTSKALYGIAAEVDGAKVVANMSQRAMAAMSRMLTSATGVRFADPATVAYIWSTCLVGPVQGLLESSPDKETVVKIRTQLIRLSVRYLVGEAEPSQPGTRCRQREGERGARAPRTRPSR
jgi:AcrR family transcriptional regulator